MTKQASVGMWITICLLVLAVLAIPFFKIREYDVEPVPDMVLKMDGFTSAYLIVANHGNLSYEVDDCYRNGSLGNCFRINWSRATAQINFSDNLTIHSGNFSWNFSETNIAPVGSYLFNFTNNGTLNFTVYIILNSTTPGYWQLFKDNHTVNISSSAWSALVNVTSNNSVLLNFTFDLYNVSSKYSNFTLVDRSPNWGVNFTINVTKY